MINHIFDSAGVQALHEMLGEGSVMGPLMQEIVSDDGKRASAAMMYPRRCLAAFLNTFLSPPISV